MFEGVESFGSNISDIFISLSSEYPAILDAFLIFFGAVGVFIGATAVFDVIKMGGQTGRGQGSSGVIAGKLIGGVGLIDLAFWAKTWSSTIWANDDPLGISSYSNTGSSDNSEAAIAAALGIMAIAGYVVIGRAYLGIAKLGHLQPDARSDLIGNIFARIVAGSALISATHIAAAFKNSSGF
ncbi:hypothetical protein LCGC14_0555570 [marine sediment metagenome]|uniref:Uncharacterized protein n=1 Tax=marine sediment metagenome TaxID=412755 RepID=A0A0F9U9W3_9ZZZZ